MTQSNLKQSRLKDYLRNQQYATASNLDARIQIHRLFKTNPYDWFRWVFDHFERPDPLRVLELGCGPGDLWLKNLDRIPGSWEITLTDFSPGMLAEAERRMLEKRDLFRFVVTDAQEIPFPDERFDIVVADHMLYHVTDLYKACTEINRVLKACGRLYAATVGANHMDEIYSLGERLIPSLREQSAFHFNVRKFTLENGGAQLKPYFSEVKKELYLDALEVTDAGPLVEYILSTVEAGKTNLTERQVEAFRKELQNQIASSGSIRVTKNTGMFMAVK